MHDREQLTVAKSVDALIASLERRYDKVLEKIDWSAASMDDEARARSIGYIINSLRGHVQLHLEQIAGDLAALNHDGLATTRKQWRPLKS